MPLQPGTTLGPYQIDALLGSGGMGEVYKARDTRLDRTVAIKVLPEHVASDPDLKQRFEREARTVAALNHPHICTLHDIGSQDGVDFLVMEYLDGQTLAQRLEKGALPLDQALQIALDIADALDKAHRQGIVHRDLKPGNIMLAKAGAKLLDFGLAKLKPVGVSPSASALPTRSESLTSEGSILGTLQYMAPEQLEGGEADQRTDIFAFGAVVYEMVTGRKAFEGKSQASLIGAILKDEPRPMSELQAMSPPSLDLIVKTCLAKEPEHRWHSIGDIRRQLLAIATAPLSRSSRSATASGSTGRLSVPSVVTAILLAAATGVTVWMLRPPAAVPAVTRLSIVAPAGVEPNYFRISPDGRTIAFSGLENGIRRVYVRSLDDVDARPLEGANGTGPAAFSPDGQELLVIDVSTAGVVRTNSSIKRVPVSAGRPVPLAAGGQGLATWGPNDAIIYGGLDGLWQVDGSGGNARQLTSLAEGEVLHYSPALSHDGQTVLFTVFSAQATSQIAAYDVETGERANLLAGTTPTLLKSEHLLFWRDGSLWAVLFDMQRLEVVGSPVLVVERVVSYTPVNVGAYAVSNNGTLVYHSGDPVATSTLGWVNRAGKMTTPVVEGPGLSLPALSPSGRHVAFTRHEGPESEQVWIYDLERRVETKLTEVGRNRMPVWAPDGARVGFSSLRGGTFGIFVRPINLSLRAELLVNTGGYGAVGSWSPDGQVLTYFATSESRGRNIWRTSVDGNTEPIVATEYDERVGKISPDGQWLAYLSNQTGEDRLYVRPFPSGDAVYPISNGYGVEPMWSRDGRELFYRRRDGFWAVDTEPGSPFRAGIPRRLFNGDYDLDPYLVGMPNYDVSLDGEQFLMIKSTQTRADTFTVVLNFFEELKARVPTN